MTPATECRVNANECLRQAKAATDPKLKAALLSVARTWTALAIQIDRLYEMQKQAAAPSE